MVTRMKIPVLAYHEVSPTLQSAKDNRTMGIDCSVLDSEFEQHIKFLYDNNINTLIPSDLLALDPKPLNGPFSKSCIITFDDGNIGNYLYAYPILKKYKKKAIFFVAQNLIGKKDMMNWTQLIEMARGGMSIQSHGVTHEPFETLKTSDVTFELEESKKMIEKTIPQEHVVSISLPHGSVHREIKSIALKLGYHFIFDSCIAYNSIQSLRKKNKKDVKFIHRISIPHGLDFIKFKEILDVSGSYVLIKRFKQKPKLIAKKLIGINNYRKIYRFINGITLQ